MVTGVAAVLRSRTAVSGVEVAGFTSAENRAESLDCPKSSISAAIVLFVVPAVAKDEEAEQEEHHNADAHAEGD